MNELKTYFYNQGYKYNDRNKSFQLKRLVVLQALAAQNLTSQIKMIVTFAKYTKHSNFPPGF